VLVENAGHFPWFENPDQFWSGLNSALESLPA
jgi:pimeloyl-ACP methyl ester carboxylesterase